MKYPLFPAALLTLSACALASPPPANTLYVLQAEAPDESGSTLPSSITVGEPEAAAGLDTARIAVLESANHLTYYNGVAWAQPFPKSLQLFLVDALQQSHRFKSVGSDKDSVLSDLSLLIDIRDGEVEPDGDAPTVRIRLAVRLVNSRTHKVIATFTVEQAAQASANHMPQIIAAFNQAANDAAEEILEHILRAIRKNAG